ncbi:hypothetical protein [Nonomuraea sp. LPB2021202275-12-8]|uniref:hypothetical protein n=1 Tax=Nonomuraea sp. LPB2021202275-12-8 TaxID=3120159 RepID=UPI00300C04F5
MYRHAVTALAVTATSMLLMTGPVAAEPLRDDLRCTMHTLDPGWAPAWPAIDALGIREALERSSGTVRVCVGSSTGQTLERLGITTDLPGR